MDPMGGTTGRSFLMGSVAGSGLLDHAAQSSVAAVGGLEGPPSRSCLEIHGAATGAAAAATGAADGHSLENCIDY
jgi:hypothetical protein